MDHLYARAVFFVADAEHSSRFYTERLGFSVDWSFAEAGRTYVCQVSLFGFEVILNQVDEQTRSRAGHGRVFIGLDPDQLQPVRSHIEAKGIPTERVNWGRLTLVMKDVDGNELYFWMPEGDWPER